MPFADRHVAVQGRRVAYVERGAVPEGGVPLVLLHGAGFDHAELTWRPIFEALSRHTRVIVPDLPGYGDSDGFGVAHTLADLGAWAVAFLDALEVARADLSGVSMGGGIALQVALDAPDRVRRLAPVASYGLMGQVPLQGLLRRLLDTRIPGYLYAASTTSPLLTRLGLASAYGDPRAAPPEVVAAVQAVARDQGARRSFDLFLRGEMRGGRLAGDLRARLPGLRRPCLLIHGTRDPIVPIRHARAARAVLPDARLWAMTSGHWPMRQFPDRFARGLWAFLGGPSPVWPAQAT
ncbi:MAG: alpha/beta fold hydrolase [Paracoccaceae bacterium]